MDLSNGGIIGTDNDPADGVASGVWNMYDLYTYVKADNWV